MPTAFRLETRRLVARCWAAGDAEDFRSLLDRNDRHLRPFIPWMRDEPMSLAATRERLQAYARRFANAEDFRYALLDHREQLVGELMMSTRGGADAREIGYLVDRDHTGRGIATEAAAMAIRAAFIDPGVDRVELHCAPENVASVGIAKRLGFQLQQEIPRHSQDSEGEWRDSQVWVLEKAPLPAGFPAAELRAFDHAGRELLLQAAAD